MFIILNLEELGMKQIKFHCMVAGIFIKMAPTVEYYWFGKCTAGKQKKGCV